MCTLTFAWSENSAVSLTNKFVEFSNDLKLNEWNLFVNHNVI